MIFAPREYDSIWKPIEAAQMKTSNDCRFWGGPLVDPQKPKKKRRFWKWG